MKGLLIKDIRLLLQQKSTVVMFAAIGLLLMLSGNQVIFAVNYMIYVAATYSLSAISYDTHDNGMAFLMTLPVCRREYVIGKYLLVYGCAIFAGAAFGGIAAVITALQGNAVNIAELGIMLLISLFVMIVLFSVMIPINIKYGAEKSRVVFMIMFAVVFAVLYLLNKIAGQTVEGPEKVLQNLERIGQGVIILAGGLLGIVLVLVSVAISVRIMENKEF